MSRCRPVPLHPCAPVHLGGSASVVARSARPGSPLARVMATVRTSHPASWPPTRRLAAAFCDTGMMPAGSPAG
jgi:hypothetical protein